MPHFLAPLSLFFAALSLPIILLYMLKLRRKDVLVSSTLLWQRLLRDREANAPWQRLRRNLLLLLQLLILALLTVALARPVVPAPAMATGHVVILLDASASMQATDVMPTRFEAARRVAREIVAGLGAEDTAIVIAVGPQPEMLGSATGGATADLRRALDDAAPTAGRADWETACALAAAGLSDRERDRVIIISDGALPAALPPLPGQVSFVEVGGAGENLAITALAIRDGPAGPQAFLRVANYGGTDAGPLVELSADGALFDARRLSIPAHAAADLTLSDLPYDLRVLEARLAIGDALPLDNVAWAVHAPPGSGRTLLVSSGNLFLERALGTLPGVSLERLPPGRPLPTEPYALYVYDGPVTGTLPVGHRWLIAPPPCPPTCWEEEAPIQVGGFFTATAITRLATGDPLLNYVDLSDVHIRRARRITPPPGARLLVEAVGGPLLFVAEQPEGRLAVLTFDLRDSDLPLHVAFPVLTANLVNWLLPRGGGQFPASIRPGDPVTIQPDPQAAEVRLTPPDGAPHTFPVGERPPVFAATGQPGVYHIAQLDPAGAVLRSDAFAVNLFADEESNITPRETVWIGQTEAHPARPEEEGRRELWPWPAAVALLMLALEWWKSQRG